jgi:hypothetical protein
MSHFTRVAVKVTNRQHLVAALQEMGHTVAENGTVRGWNTKKLSADVVATVAGSKGDIGFTRKRDGDPFEMVADWMIVRVPQREFAQQLAQEYASAGAMASAKAAGWRNLRRERQADGTIVIQGDRAM